MYHCGQRGHPVQQVSGLPYRWLRCCSEVRWCCIKIKCYENENATKKVDCETIQTGYLITPCLNAYTEDVLCVGRLNEAPVAGYGKDVGTKTTMRITYPEGAIQKPESYEKDSLFVFSAFKPLDFKWLRQMVFKEKLVRIFLNQEWKWTYEIRTQNPERSRNGD